MTTKNRFAANRPEPDWERCSTTRMTKVGRRDFVRLGLASTAGLTLGIGLAQTSRTVPLNVPTPGPGLPGPDANVTTQSNDNTVSGLISPKVSLPPRW